jgi:Putative heavy-metal-binding
VRDVVEERDGRFVLPLEGMRAVRFDTSEMGGNWIEICAYGTAVRVRKA